MSLKTQRFPIRNIQQHSSTQSFNPSLKDKDPHCWRKENDCLTSLYTTYCSFQLRQRGDCKTRSYHHHDDVDSQYRAQKVEVKHCAGEKPDIGYPRWFWLSLDGCQMDVSASRSIRAQGHPSLMSSHSVPLLWKSILAKPWYIFSSLSAPSSPVQWEPANPFTQASHPLGNLLYLPQSKGW